MSQWSKEKNNSVIQWLNENSILQDLSTAQGRVPAKIHGTALRAGDKPPALNIKEETEEEYFRQCGGNGEVPTAPDLRMIQHMLDMVRDVSPKLDDEGCSDKPLLITKPNPTSQKHTSGQTSPKLEGNTTPMQSICIDGKKKPKRQRNFAIELLLQALADKNETEQATACNEGAVLRKPDDFLVVSSKPAVTEQVQQTHCDSITPSQVIVKKVTDWIDTPKTSPFPKKTSKVFLDSSSLMFKKKSVVKENVKSEKSLKSTTSPTSNGNEYKPSEKVNEYYQKYVEQKKLRETAKEDIWARAEREMKDIDEKRRLAAKICKQSCDGTGDCVVMTSLLAKRDVPETEADLGKCTSISDDSAEIIIEDIPQSIIDQKTFAEDKLFAENDVEVKNDDDNSPANEDTEQIVDVDNDSKINNHNNVDSYIAVAQLIDIGEVEEPNVFQESHISMDDENNVNSGDDHLSNDMEVKLRNTSILDVDEHLVEKLDLITDGLVEN